jgi:hypothetical protein
MKKGIRTRRHAHVSPEFWVQVRRSQLFGKASPLCHMV